MATTMRCCFCWQSLNPHTRNVLQLGIGFFFVFLAFNSQGFIEESVLDSFAESGQVSKHAGYTSLSIIYACFTVLNFAAPPIVNFLGTRTALVFGACAYVIFLTGFLWVHQWFLYGSSALLGLGAAVIWTAQGKYLTLNSSEQSAGKHSSLFLALSQACLSCGGLFLLVVFLLTSPAEEAGNPATQNPTEAAAFSPAVVWILYGSFAVIALVGVVVLAFLPAAKKSTTEIGDDIEMEKNGKEVVGTLGLAADEKLAEGKGDSNLEQIKSIFRVAATPKMGALALSFAYTGILLSFWSSIFPTAIINTLEFRSQFSPKVLIALNGIVKGFGQPLLTLLFRWLRLHRMRRSRLVLFGVLVHLVAFGLCFLNLPDMSPLGRTDASAVIRPRVWIALLCGFLLSFGDACWSTQLFSFLITNYPTKSAEAFALLKFYQSLLTSILFYLSGSLTLHWHLLILTFATILGYFGFLLAQKLEETRDLVKVSRIQPIQQ